MSQQHLFTSESVSMGHPDKMADQIADRVLDAALATDPDARVACEVLITGELVVIAGEIASGAEMDYEQIVADTAAHIGYDDAETGFDPSEAMIQVAVQRQSPDIARGVDREDDIGAGDQGLMFGYATNQTPELMPLPITLAHRLVERQTEARREGLIEGLRPDAKTQVSIAFEGSVHVSQLCANVSHCPSTHTSIGTPPKCPTTRPSRS